MLPSRTITRFSHPSDANFRLYNGFVKLRLAHSKYGSLVLPDHLFLKAAGRWRFFQPSFFLASHIGFDVGPNLHSAMFEMDVANPRSQIAARLLVIVRSDERIKTYADGSQHYSCQVKTPEVLPLFSAGQCQRMSDGDFALRLFHHTTAVAYSKIKISKELWASAWNLQGTRKMKNVVYVYLTSLGNIRNSDDLNRIAMASNGKIAFQTTSNRPIEEILELRVYRENTTGRTHSIAVGVPSALIAPSHPLFHIPATADPAYYEVVCPEIFRVGLNPGATLPIPRGQAPVGVAALKRFDYIIVGDASETAGLAAPYDEEETRQVMLLERFEEGEDLFTFWIKNKDTNQIAGRNFELRELH